MPTWQPIWTDVRFDHAKAADAAFELRRCASLLERQTDQRMRLAATAQREWRGRARDQFDDELARISVRATWLAEGLRRLASSIDEAADDARLEQRRRESDRARWHDEQRREAERRAAQGLPPMSERRRSPTRAF